LTQSPAKYTLAEFGMTDYDQIDEPVQVSAKRRRLVSRLRLIAIALGFAFLYLFYIDDLSKNPPGFYVDESAIAYNAYCIAKTGANEFGTHFPVFFPVYTGGWTQYANPTQIYLLAIPFTVITPSISAARIYSASWVFAACLLLGWLAKKITGKETIGLLVAVIAIFTPWLFDVSRLVMETFFYPMAVVLFLLALHAAQKKETWSWMNVIALAATLMLLTYSYTIGRLLGPLLAGGLIIFVTSQPRIVSIMKTWAVYAVTLIPLLIFRSKNPEALTQRFYLISYIKPDSPWREILPKFIRRYFEDLSLISLLFDGDGNPRHHTYGSSGSFYIGAFILVLIGVVTIVVRHWREPWWRFVIFGAAASIVPGALTADQFHSLRLVAYPIFLLTLTIPALASLLETENRRDQSASLPAMRLSSRRIILAILLAVIAAQAIYFQYVFRRDGPQRGLVFDAGYKDVYDAAVALSTRPIYLVDSTEPAYVHALWYASVDGRDRTQFIHLDEGVRAPVGAIVISSEPSCQSCVVIKKSGDYLLYRTIPDFIP
jgi:4-amino-4-deoxy-L-arabinose transferase-like glycosyltransferase